MDRLWLLPDAVRIIATHPAVLTRRPFGGLTRLCLSSAACFTGHNLDRLFATAGLVPGARAFSAQTD
jgi:hypothetical protein